MHPPTGRWSACRSEQEEVPMRRIWLVALSGALATGAIALAMDDASAARRGGGVHRAGGVHAGGVNRAARAAYRPGVNRAARVSANRVGWNNNWNRPAWGVGAAAAATGLAIGATAAAASGTG